MNRETIFALQYELIQRAIEVPDVNQQLVFLLARLQTIFKANCALYLKRDTDKSMQLVLNAVVDDEVLKAHLGEVMNLPEEFDGLEDGGSVIVGPQCGTILLDNRYKYAVLFPLGSVGCVVLLAHQIISYDVDECAITAFESMGGVLTLLDVHSRERDSSNSAEQSLSEAQHQSELANAAKSEFLTRMSHELRTPLNAILGFTQLFEFDDNLTQLQLDNIKEIERAGYLMLELVSEVLDLAKIESGRIEISKGKVLLSSVLDECRSLVLNQASQRHIHLSINENCQQLYVQADQIRLKQVLINLLSNAVKYNRPGGQVKVECVGLSATRCRILISDSGAGIPPEKMKELFQPFNRLGVESAGVEGTGMGLVITKKLVELMGGIVGVESEQGVGTTFWFELQAEPTSPRVVPDTPLIESPGKSQELHILVVEDNPVNQDLLRQQLKLLGHRSDVVPHGRAALEIWQQGGYHCILSDCNMPVMDGYEMTEEIRRQELGSPRRIPIIAITANLGEREQERCHASGMDEVLSKPLDIKKLGELLVKLVGKEALIEEASPITASEAQPTPAIDPHFLANLVGGNMELRQRVLDKFLETTPASLEEIDAAIQARDGKQLKFVAHRLKSSSRSMGGNAMGDCCQQLEHAGLDANWVQVERLREELGGLWQALYDCFNGVPLKEGEVTDSHAVVIDDIDLNGLRVMILEDDEPIIEQLEMMLQGFKIHDIDCIMDGADGLLLLDDPGKQFDVLICDLNLPGMDGIEFLRHLAERQFQGGVILMSGEELRVLNSVASLATAHRLNILTALHKPVGKASLLDALQRYQAQPKKVAGQRSGSSPISLEGLKEGLEKGYVDVYFQPKVSVSNRQVIGVEALARWNDPIKGVIGPWAFIGVAEEEGLIDELTFAVFEKAMKWGGEWRKLGIDLKVAVNLSMDSLGRLELPEYFVETAQQHQMLPSMVMLEVTESRLMDNITAVLEVLTRLRLKGMALSIDDFGTGYSTMEQLKKIPFSEFKIDRSFVHGAVSDHQARAILESSITLAKKLGMNTVAEGVEDEEDWQLVKELGCDQVQGYFVSPPMPGEQFIDWLKRWNQQYLSGEVK